jgi:hypothetical protein
MIVHNHYNIYHFYWFSSSLLAQVEKKLSMSTSFQTLLGPNVWIADPGSTDHSTAHELGLCDVWKNNEGGIMVGNGELCSPNVLLQLKE